MIESTGDAYRELRSAAERALMFGERVFGDGGVAKQIAAGEWDHQLLPAQAADVAALWRALAEHIRFVRAQSGDQQFPGTLETADAPAAWLPLNRKKRYYTGTVLPMLVASDGFAHLDRFLNLCGLSVEIEPGLAGNQHLQMITEYGFAESIFTDADRTSWTESVGADTPDVVLAGPDWLVAVEAKMFHNPTAAALDRQMTAQAAIVQTWVRRRQLDPARVAHVLLLPQKLARAVGELTWPVVSWEDVLDAYRVIGPQYWANVLSVALDRYDELVSRPPAFGSNAEAKLTGAAIVEAHAEGVLEFDSVGRRGGLEGPSFKEDIATGRWRAFPYEVRSGPPPNDNWFTVAEFIAATVDEPPV